MEVKRLFVYHFKKLFFVLKNKENKVNIKNMFDSSYFYSKKHIIQMKKTIMRKH